MGDDGVRRCGRDAYTSSHSLRTPSLTLRSSADPSKTIRP